MKRFPLAIGLLSATGLAAAHEGHGMPGNSHWHASDTWGLALVGLGVAAALWWSRRK